MKKILALLLSLVFLLSCVPLVVLAEENDENVEITNIATVKNALAYATSEKNSLWTPALSLNDGKHSSDTWQGWECAYPTISASDNTAGGFAGQYCGIKFTKSEYYKIYDININLGLHAAMGGQNPHYTVQCLVEGVWVTVAEFNDSDTTPVSYATYEEAMEKDTDFYHIPSNISIHLSEPITTNNVRITVSEYAKNYPGGDVLIFPYIYEIELMGHRGETPDLELPEGAVVSTNIGYHSYPYASSSEEFRYPYCAIDGEVTSYWMPTSASAGEYLVLDFVEAKKLNKAVVSFGEYILGRTYVDYAFDIEAFVDGQWVKLASGTALDEENSTLTTSYGFSEVETKKLRIIFTEDYKRPPTVYEFEGHLSDSKTYYVEDRFDNYQKNSASKGNIAVIGTPYASTDFVPYSDVNYINDGRTSQHDYLWFTGVIDMPSYCGLKFSEKHLIDRVALYFDTPDIEGIDIMSIQIQALIDGEYVTLVTTKSYDKDMKYCPAFQFDPVETDDIRILYTAGNATFAHLRELEVYSPNGIAPMFEGLVKLTEPPTFMDFTTKAPLPQPSPQPTPTPTPAPQQKPTVLPEEDNTAVIVVVCSVSAVVLLAAVIGIVIIRKKNK
ncbi:MAG: discoidin domain-containing protein [Clostridia bacterium]|nr:discoidin domain-containing protein [Clostridia bacterium]